MAPHTAGMSADDPNVLSPEAVREVEAILDAAARRRLLAKLEADAVAERLLPSARRRRGNNHPLEDRAQ